MFLPPCIGTIVRKKVRESRNISGNCCGDFFASWCCACCAVAQTHLEVLEFNTRSMDIERV